MNRSLSLLTLLSSSSTLVCCALPALLVSLGAGGVLVSILGELPQLIWLSEHKAATFGVAGALLAGSAVLQWRARLASCPIDPSLARACTTARRNSKVIFAVSLAVYLCGATFAFVLPALEG